MGARILVVRRHERARSCHAGRHPGGDIVFAEQSPETWWTAFVAAVRKCAKADTPPETLAITGQMQDLVLPDARGVPIRSGPLYADHRATVELSTLRAEIGREWLDATRNVHDSSSTAAQLLWMSEHEPASLERTKEIVLGAPGFLRRRSTGEQVSDLTTASTTGLLDITTATWWRLMLPGCDHSTADELAAAAGPTSSCSRRWPGSGHPGGTPPHAAP